MSLITPQNPEEWKPPERLSPLVTVDRAPEQITQAFGWTWLRDVQPGLGAVRVIGLAQDGRSRFVLVASDHRPNDGIVVEADASVDPWRARWDILRASVSRPQMYFHSWMATWTGRSADV